MLAKQYKRGFSLIELMVVLGIIALLLGILIPTVSRTRLQASQLNCTSNIRQLTLAWFHYANDNNDHLVSAYTSLASDPNSWVDTGNSIAAIQAGRLYSYLRTPKVYQCPFDDANHVRSYSLSDYVSPTGNDGVPAVGTFLEIKDPSNTFTFIEENDPRGFNMNGFKVLRTGTVWIDVPAHFHATACGIGFADCHAEIWQFQDPRTSGMSAQGVDFGPDLDLIYLQNHLGY